MSKIPKFFEDFRTAYPDVAEHYQKRSDACRDAGPIDKVSGELVKLGIAIGAGTEGSAHSHARRALAAGATPQQLEPAALLPITNLRFPTPLTCPSPLLYATQCSTCPHTNPRHHS